MQYYGFEDSTHQESRPFTAAWGGHEWLSRDGEFIDEEERASRMAGANSHSRAIYTGTDVSHELVYLVNEEPLIWGYEALSDTSDATMPATASDEWPDAPASIITGISLSTPSVAEPINHWQNDDTTQSSDGNTGAEGKPQIIVQDPGQDMAELTSDLMSFQVEMLNGNIPDEQQEPTAAGDDKTEYEGMTRSNSDPEPGEDALHDESRTFHGQSIDDAVTTQQDDGHSPNTPFAVSGLNDIASPLIDELLLSAEPGLFATGVQQEIVPESGLRFTLAELVGAQGESSWNTFSDTAISGVEMSVYDLAPVALDHELFCAAGEYHHSSPG
ncbi:hypothetical protein FEM41_15770 [Jejubacter calystegiae]|uniref:Uncharacterized protein n=1 Tax=Jejubacter calystegiae TaxID=2579935 RepID=A0A4P8YJV6_9ENTR|nr:hypothetical protein [Jejubacter calystegiae]QCT20999.1 hypothetical protein FEM41_15770 [Jejubacter calystegiae]